MGGNAVNPGQEIPVGQIAGLRFTPASNSNDINTPVRPSFTFQVKDDGLTLLGGVDLDQSANLITISVTPVNDEPSGTNKTISALEDTDYTFTTADFGFVDLGDAPNSNSLAAVRITALPTGGVLTSNGQPVALGQSLSAADIASGVVVDTHVQRITRLLGLSRGNNAQAIERDLMELLPPKEWVNYSHRMIHHGRRVCIARRPQCESCVLVDLCPAARVHAAPV